jgi:plasmid stabilization system protein ParE
MICGNSCRHSEQNQPASQHAVKSIRETAQRIARHPGMGRPASDMDPECCFGDGGLGLAYRF